MIRNRYIHKQIPSDFLQVCKGLVNNCITVPWEFLAAIVNFRTSPWQSLCHSKTYYLETIPFHVDILLVLDRQYGIPSGTVSYSSGIGVLSYYSTDAIQTHRHLETPFVRWACKGEHSDRMIPTCCKMAISTGMTYWKLRERSRCYS